MTAENFNAFYELEEQVATNMGRMTKLENKLNDLTLKQRSQRNKSELRVTLTFLFSLLSLLLSAVAVYNSIN